MKKINFEPIKAWWGKVDAFLTEHKKTVKLVGLISFIVTVIAALTLTIVGIVQANQPIGSYELQGTVTMIRVTTPDEEEYDEEADTLCPVEFVSEDGEYSAIITFTIDEWLALGEDTEIDGYLYLETDGNRYVILHKEGDEAAIKTAVKNVMADEASYTFIVALAVALVAIAVGIMVFFGKYFTLYEKTWFLGIMILSAIISIISPEEGLNGVSGIWIMALYLADTFLNILCELLISKQSKWNFIVSVFVEIVEILCCIVLAYRFATMAVTLFFWLPCDIASFINWNKKKDTDDEELTKVITDAGYKVISVE
jgi:nicotinamide mononucleotide transporter